MIACACACTCICGYMLVLVGVDFRKLHFGLMVLCLKQFLSGAEGHELPGVLSQALGRWVNMATNIQIERLGMVLLQSY